MSVAYRDHPIGTEEELAEIGIRTDQYGCCAPRTTSRLGCPWYDRCPGKAFRDGKNGLKGPFNFAVFVALSPDEGAHSNTVEMPCHQYFYGGLANRKIQADVAAAQGLPHETIRIVAVQGDGNTFQERERVRAHATKDPNCPACAKGECHRMVDKLTIPRKVKPFPRPKESMASQAISRELAAPSENSISSEVDQLLASGVVAEGKK